MLQGVKLPLYVIAIALMIHFAGYNAALNLVLLVSGY